MTIVITTIIIIMQFPSLLILRKIAFMNLSIAFSVTDCLTHLEMYLVYVFLL